MNKGPASHESNVVGGEWGFVAFAISCASIPTAATLVLALGHSYQSLWPQWAISAAVQLTVPLFLAVAFHWFFTAGAIAFSLVILIGKSAGRARVTAMTVTAISLGCSLYLRSASQF